VQALHLKPQVPLADKPLATLVDLALELSIDLDALVQSVLPLLVEDLDTLADRLVVVDVGEALDVVAYVELLLEFEV